MNVVSQSSRTRPLSSAAIAGASGGATQAGRLVVPAQRLVQKELWAVSVRLRPNLQALAGNFRVPAGIGPFLIDGPTGYVLSLANG
jgi:hypothetical protein